MVSSNKADLDLRESMPMPRNILHSQDLDPGYTWHRASQKVLQIQSDFRCWFSSSTSTKDSADHLSYSADARDTATSGNRSNDNRHLNYLVESTSVNVGGSHQNAKVSSLPMSVECVG